MLAPVSSSSLPIDGLEVPLIELPPQDHAALERAAPVEKSHGRFTFAAPIDVSISHSSTGVWRPLLDGRLQWQVIIHSEGAHSLNLGFDQYSMPEGGELRIYAPESDPGDAFQVFTAGDNDLHGELWTAIVDGDRVMIDATIPKDSVDDLKLSLGSVNHGFRDYRQRVDPWEKIGGDTTGACNVDVICGAETLPGLGEEIDKYRDQIRAVGAYTLNGRDTCSGALVNNTANDGTPYFLTAEHCGISASNAASMVVYWNFECSYCRVPGSAESGQVGDGQLDQFNTGAILRAEYSPSDFALVELDDPIDPEYEVFYAGWDNSGADATTSAIIHHPDVAEKRISFEFDDTSVTSWGLSLSPGDGTHIRVADWDAGTTEPGSSGGALFDQNGRIIGQLHGGFAACGVDEPDWFGRLAHSWDGGGTPETRLSDWLDPLGTGAVTLDGLNAATSQGVIAFDTALAAGDPVRILLRDADLTASSVTITLTASGGDSELVTLTEVNPGDYQASVDVA